MDNNFYWLTHIKNELKSNGNLFCEFEMSGNKTYNYNPIIFSDDYQLQEISKKTLLEMIKSIVKVECENKKYFITTRSKYDSNHYFIVVSIIQN